MLRKKKGCKKGFTLVELVIVIAVIAILAAVLIPTFISIINKANQSKDLQLVTNMNYAITEARIDSDYETPDNLRTLLRENGINNLELHDEDDVIVFNTTSKQFEIKNVDDLIAENYLISTYANDSEEKNLPYYAEEIFDGYIIVSKSGNPLAEALYELRNITYHPWDSERSSIETTINNALGKISNEHVLEDIKKIMGGTVFVGNPYMFYTVNFDGENSKVNLFSVTSETTDYFNAKEERYSENPHTRVVFAETLDSNWYDNSGDLYSVKVDCFLQANLLFQVIVPNHISISVTTNDNSHATHYDKAVGTNFLNMPNFAGNVNYLRDIGMPAKKVFSVEQLKEWAGNRKTALLVSTDHFYVSHYDSLQEAMADATSSYNKTKYEKTVVLNEDYEIKSSEEVIISKGVTLEIPYGLDYYDYTLFDTPDSFTGRFLGDAFPALDDEAKEVEDLYYFCGEGPGATESYTASSAYFEASRNIAEESKVYYTLTIPQGVALTVYGNVRVGGVIGYPDASGYQGHTSGAYGQIINNGSIVVEKNGELDVWGFIKGDGNVEAKKGATVYEPFVVADYLDAMPTMLLYPFVDLVEFGYKISAAALNNNGNLGFTQLANALANMRGNIDKYDMFNSPFSRYAVMNIQNTFTINYGAELIGRANLFVNFGPIFYLFAGKNVNIGMYARANAPLVNYDNHSAAIQLTEGSKLVCSYNSDTKVDIAKGYEAYESESIDNLYSLAGDIGKTTVEIHGKVTTGGIEMDLLSGFFASFAGGSLEGELAEIVSSIVSPVSTAKCILPVPYNFDFTVANGGTFIVDDNTKFAIMPGSVLKVENGGTLTVNKGSELYVLDASYATNAILPTVKEAGIPVAIKYYPSATLLEANGLSGTGAFIVNGTLSVKNGAYIGGIVQSDAQGATIDVSKNANTEGKFTLGGRIDEHFQNGLIAMLVMAGNQPMDLNIFATYYEYPLRVLSSDGELINVNPGEKYTMGTAITRSRQNLGLDQIQPGNYGYVIGSGTIEGYGIDILYRDLDNDGIFDWNYICLGSGGNLWYINKTIGSKSKGWYIDIDCDGVADIWYIDTTGDGELDTWYYSVVQWNEITGKIERITVRFKYITGEFGLGWYFDSNGNGKLDMLADYLVEEMGFILPDKAAHSECYNNDGNLINLYYVFDGFSDLIEYFKNVPDVRDNQRIPVAMIKLDGAVEISGGWTKA